MSPNLSAHKIVVSSDVMVIEEGLLDMHLADISACTGLLSVFLTYHLIAVVDPGRRFQRLGCICPRQ